MADIFISYKTEDRPRAGQFVKALRSQEWEVWWDQEILPGQNWDDEITRNLSRARCIVVLWSQACARSEWIEDETLNGLGSDILVPVLLDDAPLPWVYRRIQAISLKMWNGDAADAVFQSFVRGIRWKLSEGRKRSSFWIRLWRGYVTARRVLAVPNKRLDRVAAKIRGNGRRWLRAAFTLLGTLILIGVAALAVESWGENHWGWHAYAPQDEAIAAEVRKKAEKIEHREHLAFLAIFAAGVVLAWKVWKLPDPKSSHKDELHAA